MIKKIFTIKGMAWVMFALLIVYQIIDTIQTDMLLMDGAEEANPIIAWMISMFGVYGIWMFKFFFIAMFGICLYYFFRYRDKVNAAKLCDHEH